MSRARLRAEASSSSRTSYSPTSGWTYGAGAGGCLTSNACRDDEVALAAHGDTAAGATAKGVAGDVGLQRLAAGVGGDRRDHDPLALSGEGDGVVPPRRERGDEPVNDLGGPLPLGERLGERVVDPPGVPGPARGGGRGPGHGQTGQVWGETVDDVVVHPRRVLVAAVQQHHRERTAADRRAPHIDVHPGRVQRCRHPTPFPSTARR